MDIVEFVADITAFDAGIVAIIGAVVIFVVSLARAMPPAYKLQAVVMMENLCVAIFMTSFANHAPCHRKVNALQ